VIYLYVYLGIGVVTLAIVVAEHWLTKERASEWLQAFLLATQPERENLSYRILNRFVVPALAALAIVLAWPVALYRMGKEFLANREAPDLPEEKSEFKVEREHLQELLTISQIEAREAVEDPLGAVPKLPFGHLNAGWKRFIEGARADEELWSFTAHWKTAWGREWFRSGYVIVRDGAPTRHFLTALKDPC
jgi:hypothetical protein